MTHPIQTSTKHTPGPWHAFNHSWCETSVLAHGFDHAVCLLDINYATEESQEADEAQMAANAHLIAAAPDLKEAVIELLNGIDGCGDPKEARRLARAALAKSEGRSS